MTRSIVIALSCVLLTGCASEAPSPCAGLKYEESGLSRRQFVSCAAAMVKDLDREQRALEILGDASRSKEQRLQAKQDCLSAGSDLARLIRQAGGAQKLMAQWDDRRLNEFNIAVDSARSVYLMYCYYGLKGEEIRRPDPTHEKARQILAEIR